MTIPCKNRRREGLFASIFVTFILMNFSKNSKIQYPRNVSVLIKLQKSMSKIANPLRVTKIVYLVYRIRNMEKDNNEVFRKLACSIILREVRHKHLYCKTVVHARLNCIGKKFIVSIFAHPCLTRLTYKIHREKLRK